MQVKLFKHINDIFSFTEFIRLELSKLGISIEAEN